MTLSKGTNIELQRCGDNDDLLTALCKGFAKVGSALSELDYVLDMPLGS